MKRILHYIYDPFCGWCYAAEKLTDAASLSSQGKFEIQLHAGGLFSNMRLPDRKRAHIKSADAHIGRLTGQVFGEAYLNGLLEDRSVIYDSVQPIKGILLAETIKLGTGIQMLKALQQAHYVHGLRIVEPTTIVDIAHNLGFDKAEFLAAFNHMPEDSVQKHLDQTHELMRNVNAQGFPTFVAQIGDEFKVLPHEHYYADPKGFISMALKFFVE